MQHQRKHNELFQRIPGLLDQYFDEIIVDRTVNKKSRSTKTYFALVQKARIQNGWNHFW